MAHETPGGAEFRLDALTRRWVAITEARQSRPNLPTDDCPFCVGGTEAPAPYAVKAFPNRWPPLTPGAPAEFPDDPEARIPGRGAAEVVLYSPEHHASLSTLSREAVREVIDLWIERTVELSARPEVAYVLIFENRGAEVGATIPHPHGQIYAFPFVPPVAEREAEVAALHGCPVCAETGRALEEGERVVRETESFVAFAHSAPSWPFDLLLVPRAHVVELGELDDGERDDLADVLQGVLGGLDRVFDLRLPYMFWIHPGVHLHIHVVSPSRSKETVRYIAAGEVGSGVMFNPVAPETAARMLRDALPEESVVGVE
jgi:UDPglucose--hexose-1-phosphate uridylyltransferase